MKKNGKNEGMKYVIILFALLGVVYVLLYSNQYGIKVSCDQKEILIISKG